MSDKKSDIDDELDEDLDGIKEAVSEFAAGMRDIIAKWRESKPLSDGENSTRIKSGSEAAE